MDKILEGLNEAQNAAVTSHSKVVQVLAPPGSGKTKTLTARVAYLIANNGLDPSRIIVCTFTVKAAREMKHRIEAFLGDELAARLVLGTFHSIARRLLVKHGHLIGLDRNFGIADTSDSTSLIGRIIKQRDLTIKRSVARHRISSLKADGVNAEKHSALLASSKGPSVDKQEFDIVYTEYEEQLKVSNLLDYDDLLLYCTRLLRAHPSCLSHVEAVLIDEFQDTNHVQYDLMTLFAHHQRTITIVGDPDQSIYGWRSAKIENLHKMRLQYSDTHVVNLEENYRSSGCILMAAQEIIEQDKDRPQKSLTPTHSLGERPALRMLASAHMEADWMVSEMQRARALTGGLLLWSDFAVLIRSASLSRLVEAALGKVGIPYRMVGGHRFFDRAEVKLILDYLRCIDNTDHTEAMTRIINVPSRKIGDASVQRLLGEAAERKQSLWTVVLGVSRGTSRVSKELSEPARKGLDLFVNLVLTAQRRLDDGSADSLADFVEWFLGRLQLQDHLASKYPDKEDSEARWANVQELVAQAAEASLPQHPTDGLDLQLRDGSEVASEDKPSRRELLAHFLANIALSTDSKESDAGAEGLGNVTLSTMHAAKGLEWPVVFIPAAYSGSIPHSRSEDMDEERRLLYVAMTRAQALLYLSCPAKDSMRGETTLSPFLSTGSVRATQTSRGPTFSYDLVREIAKILRRQSQHLDIEKGRASLESLEDDVFPQWRKAEDGEDMEDDELHWTAQRDRKVLTTVRTSKRGLDDDECQELFRKWAKAESSGSSFVTATTMMQRNGHCSVATTMQASTFVSAKTLPRVSDNKENAPPDRRPFVKVASVGSARSSKVNKGQCSMDAFVTKQKPRSDLGKPEREAPHPGDDAGVILQRQWGPDSSQQGLTHTHRTSMDLIASQRRTLGVKRQNGNGWAARHSNTARAGRPSGLAECARQP